MPVETCSIGGDEVVLCHAAYLANHIDRHLFVADFGNARIVNVKFDCDTKERVSQKQVPDWPVSEG